MLHPTTAQPPGRSLDDYRGLTRPLAAGALRRAAAMTGELTAKIDRLRLGLSPARASLVLAQIELRRRGSEKFAAAERMFFTPLGLEQSSDEIVAAYKAARLAPGKRVFDLCSGIGGDLVALARKSETLGLDRDPVSAVIAAANARELVDEARRPTVQVGDAADADLSACDAWHIDPDRRPRGGRTTCVELHDPPAEAIDRLLARNANAAVKLAPAAVWPDSWTDSAEMEWISRGRQCRQLVAWFGAPAKNPGQRRATMLGSNAEPLDTLTGAADQHVPVAPRIERFLFEPDAAVLAAKLDAALAAQHNLAAVSAGIAYWTGAHPIADAMLAGFEVDEVLPLDLKRLGALLRGRSIGRLEIKVRGVDQNPAELRRHLRVRGDVEATLLVTRIANRVTAILARRISPTR
jgi:hypothetical protein